MTFLSTYFFLTGKYVGQVLISHGGLVPPRIHTAFTSGANKGKAMKIRPTEGAPDSGQIDKWTCSGSTPPGFTELETARMPTSCQ